MSKESKYAIIFDVNKVGLRNQIIDHFTKEGYYNQVEGMLISPHENPVQTIMDFRKYIEETGVKDNLHFARLIRLNDEGDLLE